MPDYTLLTVASGAALWIGLGALSVIDWRTMRLPDALTWPLILGGLAYQWIVAADFYPYLLGAFIGYGAFWLIEILYKRLRGRDGLGRGDAKLMAAGGAWCGALALPFIVFMGSAAGLIYVVGLRRGERIERLPFGPFLAVSIGLVWAGLQLA